MEVGKSIAAVPLDIDPERYKAMELRLQDVSPEDTYDLYMKSDEDISEEYADLRAEDPEAFDAVLRVNADVNRQAMDRAQFSVEDAVAGSPIPEIDTYLMENSVYLNAIPPGFERERDLNDQATAHVIPESPIVERTQRGQLPGLAADVEEQDRVRLHETTHASGIMGNYDSLTTKLLEKTIGDEASAEAATTGLDLYRAISRDDPIAARESINYLLKQKVNLYLHRDDLVDNMMRAIDVLEENSDGGIELTPERKVEIRKDIEKEFKNVPRILENMRLERAGEKEAPKMNQGGLMAADGVDVSKSASDLALEFDPFDVITQSNVRFLDQDVENMDDRLELAYRDYANGEITRDQYAATVRNVQKHNPEKFEMYFLGPNTDRRIELLNYEAFSDNPLPHMQEESDEIPYSLTIPFGAEKDTYLGGRTGLKGTAHKDNNEIFVAGKDTPEQSLVARHEMRHLKHGEQKGVSHSEEEDRMRAFDALHAVLNQDKDALNTIFDIEYGAEFKENPENFPQYSTWFGRLIKNRVQEAVNLLPELYWTGVFDKNKADKELVKQFLEDYDKDEQGLIDSLLGNEPEKQKDVSAEINTSSADAKKLAKLLSTAPFVKEIGKRGGNDTAKVRYDIDREAAEMNDGGLMQDPLVLSETAEEEAAPKMSIGEYAQGIKDFGEDLSPAGTADAIIETGKNLLEGQLGKAAISALGAIPGGKTAGKAAKALEVGVDTSKLTGDQLRNYASATVKMLEDTAKQTGKVAGDKGSKLYAPVEEGTKVAVRKNLNSSVGADVDPSLNTLQTLHAGTYSGKALSYMPVVTVKNAEFAIGQAGRRDIAAKILGKETDAAKNKFPMAAVNGEYASGPSLLEQYVPTDLVEVGFNPKFNHLFIDMQTGQAVKGAEEATIIGDRVYAKGVTYWKKSEAPEPLPTSKGEELPSDVRYREMNAGGLMLDEYNRAES